MDIFLSPLPPAPPGHKYDDEDDGDDDDEKVLPSKAIRVAQGTHFPNAWCRMRLQDAHDQRDFPSVLRLAQEIITLDGEDVNLASSKTYRGTLSEKDVELTAIILHHLDRDAIECLINCDYNGLKNNSSLPPQLTEVLDDDPVSYQDKDGTKKHPKRPIIYMHFLVDSNGKPPTLNEMVALKPYIQSYINVASAAGKKSSRGARKVDKDRVKAVDGAVPAPAIRAKAEVKFKAATATAPAVLAQPAILAATSRKPWKIEPGQPDGPRYGKSANLILGLSQLLAAIQDEEKTTPLAEWGDPMKHAVSETGWTGYPNRRRFEQAECGENTNKIMALIGAAARLVHPLRIFRMRWLIVLEVIRPDIAGPGEKGISRVAASYTTAGGLNGTLAGLSVVAAEGLTGKDYTRVCNQRAHLLLPSIENDKKMVEDRLEEVEKVADTFRNWKRIDQLQHIGVHKLERLDGLDEQFEVLKDDLLDNAPKWNEKVYREMTAVQDQKKLSDLAKGLKGLI